MNEEVKDQEEINEVEETVENKINEEETTTEDNSYDEQIKELNDKHLRLYSDFENFRRRTAKEKIDLIGSASSGVISKLLPVLDDFERAIKANETSTDIDAVKEGFDLLYNKLHSILSTKGLKEMEAKKQTFDSDLHEAITKIPAPKKELKGKIVDVVEKGYYLNDKIIRHAKVVIGE